MPSGADGIRLHLSWWETHRPIPARYCQIDRTALAPSPTAVATRLAEPNRTSPAANPPRMLVLEVRAGWPT